MESRVYGVLGISSIMSNWNADFSGYPKTTQSQLIYGSDKALKYSMKKMWEEEGKNVLYIKSMKIDEKQKQVAYRTLKERYEDIFDEKLEAKNKNDIINNLFSTVDIKNFGATFAVGKKENYNVSITGAVQFGQGFNKYKWTNIEEQAILSPFKRDVNNGDEKNNKKIDDGEKKEPKEPGATSIGTKIMCDEAHYFYPFVINPLAYKEYKKLGIKNAEYTMEDYKNFKRTAIVSATSFSTNSKEGCENEFALFVETEKELYLPNLTEYITFEKGEKLNIIDISGVATILNEFEDRVKNIEIYYNPYTTELISGINKEKRYNIITQKEV